MINKEMASAVNTAALPPPMQASSWQSPVPYLFCALAAMLGLIALALLILGYSYWKLSGNLESRDNDDAETGGGDDGEKEVPAVADEKYLVIMAGQDKPTFLATPTSSRASSLCSKSSCNCKTGSTENSLPLEESFEEKWVERGGQIVSAVNHFQ